MSYELTGKLHEIFDEQQVSEKFRKREAVVEVPDGSYTQFIKLQFTQDKCGLLDAYQVGQEVKVSFNLSGKPFTKNGTTLYFTNLNRKGKMINDVWTDPQYYIDISVTPAT